MTSGIHPKSYLGFKAWSLSAWNFDWLMDNGLNVVPVGFLATI